MAKCQDSISRGQKVASSAQIKFLLSVVIRDISPPNVIMKKEFRRVSTEVNIFTQEEELQKTLSFQGFFQNQ